VKSSIVLVALLALAVSSGGCMTWDTRTDPGYDGPRIYSGTRLAAQQAGQQFWRLNLAWVLLFGIDIPLSFVADTLLLPVTIPEERERRATLAERMQMRDERPSPIAVAPGTHPVKAAKQLFEACVELLERYNPLLTDCFAQDARIFFDEGDPHMLTGAEYKERLRAAVAEFQQNSEFVTWRRARYAQEGDRVRIDVERSSSERGDSGEVTFWAARGEDEGWRFVELRGARWR